MLRFFLSREGLEKQVTTSKFLDLDEEDSETSEAGA
jgi:hypothetical protein